MVINSRDAGSSELIAIATDLNFDSNNDGYIVKVLDDNNSGSPKYWKYEAAGGGSADWTETDPVYTSFRLSNIGLDFGIGSDRIIVKNSALLLQELEKNPEKVKALFSDARIESTKTATASDLLLTPTPQTLNNNDPNNPTGTNATVGDTIANSAAYDANTSSYRSYQGFLMLWMNLSVLFLAVMKILVIEVLTILILKVFVVRTKELMKGLKIWNAILSREKKTLSDGFMRMEEMQSQLNTQLQTLQNSFNKK